MRVHRARNVHSCSESATGWLNAITAQIAHAASCVVLNAPAHIHLIQCIDFLASI